jgi:hypothetical protein
MENKDIEEYVRLTREIIEGFNLQIVYFATKFIENKFEFFAPFEAYSSYKAEVNEMLSSLRDYCNKKRNPLLEKEEI